MQQQQRTLHETFQATPQAVPEARRLVGKFIDRCCPDAPEETRDAVALTVSEAVGNAVRHAYPDHTGSVQLTAKHGEGSLLITITDQGVGRANPSLDPGCGVGLVIMRRMADAQIDDLPCGGVQVSLRFPLGVGIH